MSYFKMLERKLDDIQTRVEEIICERNQLRKQVEQQKEEINRLTGLLHTALKKHECSDPSDWFGAR